MKPEAAEMPPPAAVPQQARALLGERADALAPYARLLAGAGIDRGLLGPREVPRLWDRHLLNCAAVAAALPPSAAVLDIGSGAGLPGVVWALLRPDLRITLVEPRLRRATFLTEIVSALGLDEVQVRRARAEELHGLLVADVVASRAVAPLERLADWCLPLVRPGGGMWALKGRTAQPELETALPALQRAGATDAFVASYGEGVLDQPTRVVHVKVSTVSTDSTDSTVSTERTEDRAD